MFVRHAKELCPQLVIVPYNFEAYEEVLLELSVYCILSRLSSLFDIVNQLQVADQFYDILHRHCRKVQVSLQKDRFSVTGVCLLLTFMFIFWSLGTKLR